MQGLLRIMGIVLLLIGIGGFFQPTTGPIYNLLHLSASHNLVHLLTGIIFLAVSGNFQWSKVVAIVFGILYAIVAVMGLFMKDIFGFISATPTIEVIHFLVALLALYSGLKATESTPKSQSESA